MRDAFVRSLVEEYQHPVDAELLPRFQQVRFPAHRTPVQRFALPVAVGVFDNADHEVRVVRPDLEVVPLQELQEPLAGQYPVFPGDDRPVNTSVDVFQDGFRVLSLLQQLRFSRSDLCLYGLSVNASGYCSL